MNARKEQLLSDIALIDKKLALGDPKVRKAYLDLKAKKEAEIAQIDADYKPSTTTAPVPEVAPEPTPAPTELSPETSVPDPLGPDEQL